MLLPVGVQISCDDEEEIDETEPDEEIDDGGDTTPFATRGGDCSKGPSELSLTILGGGPPLLNLAAPAPPVAADVWTAFVPEVFDGPLVLGGKAELRGDGTVPLVLLLPLLLLNIDCQHWWPSLQLWGIYSRKRITRMHLRFAPIDPLLLLKCYIGA